ncbi:MAG TPA: hypothetical protein VJR89_14065 [Polyangiales bacterium]|nr:hypothetical protein [Polyangiales bacterium]
MSADLTPQQALAIYSLVFATTEEGRRPFSSKLEPLKAAAVKDLVKRGLLELEAVKPQGKRVSLSDKGWAWAAEHLGLVQLSKADATATTLEDVLLRLREHLAGSGRALAHFVQPTLNGMPQTPVRVAREQKKRELQADRKRARRTQRKPAPTSGEPKAPASREGVGAAPHNGVAAERSPDLPSRIRATCLDIAHGSTRTRVRLRELRARLPDVPKDKLDRELVELQNAGSLVLYRIDDPTDIQPEDERAALHVAGAPRHILYLEH